jgi:hypothetical protein
MTVISLIWLSAGVIALLAASGAVWMARADWDDVT